MDENKLKKINIICLALGIAILPPIWAVFSPYMGISTGAVALICAGLYVANGNKSKDALKIIVGFLFGDLWAVIAINIMAYMNLNPNIELYITLFILGGLAVIIGESFPKFIFLPAWLCGWAIGLTIMGPIDPNMIGSLPTQIGVAMIFGVLYVGIGVDIFQKFLVKIILKNSNLSKVEETQKCK